MGELYKQLLQLDFYPRPPRGGRRRVLAVMQGLVPISIHALREEGDKAGEPVTIPLTDFYPRPPRGGRRLLVMSSRGTWLFLSTPSARRATHLNFRCFCFFSISIHALREEGDLAAAQCEEVSDCISIHALREEGDGE